MDSEVISATFAALMTNPLTLRNGGLCTAWFAALLLAFSAKIFAANGTLVSVDKTTQGTWQGVYGAEGYLIPAAGGSSPSGVAVSFSGSSQWVWNYNSFAVQALQKPNSSDRVASVWYAPSSHSINVNFSDTQPHRIAIYCMDWDNGGRQQTVTLTDAATGAVLNSQTISSFQSGIWLVYEVQGNVAINLKAISGNAIVNGLFFGAPGNTTVTPAPSFNQVATPVISPPGGTFATAGTTFTATTSTSGAWVYYTIDGSTPTTSSPRATGPITLSVSATVKAKAFAAGMTDSGVASATFTKQTAPTPTAGTSATFVKQDTTTQGNWMGNYGGDGNNIAKNGGTLPAYAAVAFSGASDWSWNWNSTDIAALQKNGASDRVASCWYAASSYNIAINLNDGLTHRLAIYCLDWDQSGRNQTITVSDTATGAVLNSQTIANFSRGVWLVWDVKGKITLNVKSLNAKNAVVSGLFFGLGAPNVVPVQQVATPVITPPGGTFATAQTVTITTATSGATIRYTMDGSTPSASSAVYTGPLTPSTALTIKARAFKSGMTDSAEASAVFNISNPTTPSGPLADLGALPNRVFPAPEGFDTVQYAADGRLGFIVWRDQQLIYRERTVGGSWSETVVNGGGNVFQMLTSFTYTGPREDYRFQPAAILLYDLQSQPHVLQANGRNVAHYTKGSGGWALFENIANPATSENLWALVGGIGANNVIHLAALSVGGPRKLTYGTNKGGSWNWTLISTVTDAALSYWQPPYAPRWLSLAVDSRNFAHMTYRTSMDLSYDSAGHPRAYSELKYASNASGQWATRLVQKPFDISAEAANGASIAIAPDDKPRIASWYNDRGDGGSASESRLYYHEPDGSGNWTGTIVIKTPDGYSAGDGPKGTGFSPYLRFDASGRPHVLFLDQAGEHFGGIGQQEYAGNLRHAWRNGSTWSFETIYRQVAPLEREIMYPAFAMRGNEMAVTLLQRDTRWNYSSYPPLSNSTYYFRFFTKPLP